MNKALDVSAAFSSNMIRAALSANHKLNGVRPSLAPGWKAFKEDLRCCREVVCGLVGDSFPLSQYLTNALAQHCVARSVIFGVRLKTEVLVIQFR